jgi:hypothetical protein
LGSFALVYFAQAGNVWVEDFVQPICHRPVVIWVLNLEAAKGGQDSRPFTDGATNS